jgi:CBS domain-containing protein
MTEAMPRLREHMTLVPCTIACGRTLRDADAQMEQLGVRHLPVVDAEGALVGLLSRRELQALMHARDVDPGRVQVERAARREVYAVSPETALAEVCETMAEHRYGCAIAVQAGRPLGIFTTADACAALAQRLRAATHG